MTFATRIASAAALGMAMMSGAGLPAPSAQAAYIVTLTEQGNNVVANGSGTIDTTDLSFVSSGSTFAAQIRPNIGLIETGPASVESQDIYIGITGPTTFGSGGNITANSGSGDIVGVRSFIGQTLDVPVGYVSGSPLSDTSTYDNQTFASLGVTPGTYVWTWGSGAHADSFTLEITVPEPSSIALMALPLGLVLLLAARHRRDIPTEL